MENEEEEKNENKKCIGIIQGAPSLLFIQILLLINYCSNDALMLQSFSFFTFFFTFFTFTFRFLLYCNLNFYFEL